MRGHHPTHRWRAWRVAILVLLVGGHSGLAMTADTCHPPTIHADYPFPVEQLNALDQCRVERIVQNAATSGVIGPTSLPIAPVLYRYLLDHPVIAAALVRHLDIAPYRITREAPGRYWVDDGEGAQGRLDVLYRDDTTGIYVLEGFYENGWLPRITGKLVFFLRFNPATPDETALGMETVTVSYVRLDRAMLHWLLKFVSPLVEPAVTHRISRLFRAAETLGTRLTNDSARIRQSLPRLDSIEPADRRQLDHLLKQVAHEAVSKSSSSPP